MQERFFSQFLEEGVYRVRDFSQYPEAESHSLLSHSLMPDDGMIEADTHINIITYVFIRFAGILMRVILFITVVASVCISMVTAITLSIAIAIALTIARICHCRSSSKR